MWVVRCVLACLSTLGFIIMAIVHGLIENYQIDDAKVEYIDFSNHSNYYCRLMAQGIVHDQNRVLRHVRQHSKEYLQLSLVGALAEWMIGVSFLAFLGLYTYEFKKFEHIKVQLIRQNRPLCLREPLKSNKTKDAETQFYDLDDISDSRAEENLT